MKTIFATKLFALLSIVSQQLSIFIVYFSSCVIYSNDNNYNEIFSYFSFCKTTKGAGDAFVGALAHYLARYPDVPLYRKVGGAVTIASMSVQQYGTQSSYPLAKDLRFDITLKNFDWSYV